MYFLYHCVNMYDILIRIDMISLLQFEGTPFFPDNDRYWSCVEKYKVTQFYTAPTAIRALMKFGEHNVKRYVGWYNMSLILFNNNSVQSKLKVWAI